MGKKLPSVHKTEQQVSPIHLVFLSNTGHGRQEREPVGQQSIQIHIRC